MVGPDCRQQTIGFPSGHFRPLFEATHHCRERRSQFANQHQLSALEEMDPKRTQQYLVSVLAEQGGQDLVELIFGLPQGLVTQWLPCRHRPDRKPTDFAGGQPPAKSLWVHDGPRVRPDWYEA